MTDAINLTSNAVNGGERSMDAIVASVQAAIAIQNRLGMTAVIEPVGKPEVPQLPDYTPPEKQKPKKGGTHIATSESVGRPRVELVRMDEAAGRIGIHEVTLRKNSSLIHHMEIVIPGRLSPPIYKYTGDYATGLGNLHQQYKDANVRQKRPPNIVPILQQFAESGTGQRIMAQAEEDFRASIYDSASPSTGNLGRYALAALLYVDFTVVDRWRRMGLPTVPVPGFDVGYEVEPHVIESIAQWHRPTFD
jgi:hypothetical protein